MKDLWANSEGPWVEALGDRFSVHLRKNLLVFSGLFNHDLGTGRHWDGAVMDQDKVPALTELL